MGLPATADGASATEVEETAAVDDDEVGTAFAAGTITTYTEPWLKRVREVDDDTMQPLLRTLVQLRRIRNVVTGAALVGGAFFFGVPNVTIGPVALLVYGTLALTIGMPIHAIGSLAVRRMFLQEAKRHGLSRTASLLLLTRAERRARTVAPSVGIEKTVDKLSAAVRDPDRAD